MPDFTAPEYASYVTLCKELRMERRLRVGDAVWTEADGVDVWFSMGDYQATDNLVWLPQLADWLEKLEVRQIDTVTFKTNPAWPAEHQWSCEGELGEWWEGTGPTREEAAAKLWMAVTGRTVNA